MSLTVALHGVTPRYLRPILSSRNQLTRLNTVSTMSRLETSPTSTRPASTPNFIFIPRIGTPVVSATAPDVSSFPSPGCAAPAVSSLAIAKEGRDRWRSQVRHLFTSNGWGGGECSRCREEKEGSSSPSAGLLTVRRHTKQTFSTPSNTV